MPVVVVAGLMVCISALTASPGAANFCAGKPEAILHPGAMAMTSAGDAGEQVVPACGCADLELTDQATSRCDGSVWVTPVPVAAGRSEPTAVPSAVALVAVAIAVMLGTIEVLFRCTIYERPSSADHRAADKKGVRGT